MILKGKEYIYIVIIKNLIYDTNKSKIWLFERRKSSPSTSTVIFINVPEYTPQAQNACYFKCLYSPEEFRSMWSPHPWFVSTVITPLGHTETARCLIVPVALSSCKVIIQVKLPVQLLQYHGLTASL